MAYVDVKDVNAAIEKALEKQWNRIERQVKSEIDRQFHSHFSILPNILLDKLQSSLSFPLNLHQEYTPALSHAAFLAVPRGDSGNERESTKDCIEKFPDTTDNNTKKVVENNVPAEVRAAPVTLSPSRSPKKEPP